MVQLGENLRKLIKKHRINVLRLAKSTGVGQSVIHRIVTGETANPSVGTLSPLVDFFGVSLDQLVGLRPLALAGNPHHCTTIPVLRWEHVSKWHEEKGDAENLVEGIEPLDYIVADFNIDPHGYALIVNDTTMRPRFPEGTLVIVDPSREPRDSDFAVVKTGQGLLPVFKQILIDGPDVYLKPLNQAFSMQKLADPYRFLGVMVQTRMTFHQADQQIGGYRVSEDAIA